ncbi:MAG: hypothetical protein HQK79_02855 [Desulfobacterales bacterium]|nr:hypothetical protein [Desulfobacterales bacterium]
MYNFKNDEEGYFMVTVIFILLILTIIGTSSINSSITEIQIARNDSDYQKNFYLAESAVMEAAQRAMDQTNDIMASYSDTWFSPQTVGAIDMYTSLCDPNNWVTTGANVNSAQAGSFVNPNVRPLFAIVDRGFSRGASLEESTARLHNLTAFGLVNTSGSARVMIEIGIKRRF